MGRILTPSCMNSAVSSTRQPRYAGVAVPDAPFVKAVRAVRRGPVRHQASLQDGLDGNGNPLHHIAKVVPYRGVVPYDVS
ncbi:MAG: hypothetical protein VW987_11090 [Alphaproteobacteria bacterium]